MKQKRSKKVAIGIVIAILAILIAAVMIYIMIGINPSSNEEADIPRDTENTYVEYPDVDKYFEENAEVISIVPVADATDIMTEGDIIRGLEMKGFSDIFVTTSYAMNGEYYDEQEINEESTDKHPMYEASYLASSGEIWTITIINGQIMAVPISYQLQYETEQAIVISESETVTSYDSLGNRFFISVPHGDCMIVKVVDEINAQVLDSLTAEEIEKL